MKGDNGMDIEDIKRRYILIRTKKDKREYEIIREVNKDSIRNIYDQYRLMRKNDPDYGIQIALFSRETERLLYLFDSEKDKAVMLSEEFIDYFKTSVAKVREQELEDPYEFDKETSQKEKQMIQESTAHQQMIDILLKMQLERAKINDRKEKEYNEYLDINSGFNLSGAGSGFYDLQAAERSARDVDGFSFKHPIRMPAKSSIEDNLEK